MTDAVIVMTKDDFVGVIENAARQAVAEAMRKIPKGDQPRPLHVTPKQAAEILGLSPTTVGKLVNSGKLKLNGCGMIPMLEIDRIIRD